MEIPAEELALLESYTVAGAEFMDELVPTWPVRTDLATLDLSQSSACIAGQNVVYEALEGSYDLSDIDPSSRTGFWLLVDVLDSGTIELYGFRVSQDMYWRVLETWHPDDGYVTFVQRSQAVWEMLYTALTEAWTQRIKERLDAGIQL